MEKQDIFQSAKFINIKDYIETHYGFSFKGNTILCPFHEEKTPSFSVSTRLKLVTCFGGCSWNDGKNSGDVIDFVSKYCGLSKLDAAKRICGNDDRINSTNDEKKILKKIKFDNKKREIKLIKKARQEMKVKSNFFLKSAEKHKQQFITALSEVVINHRKIPDRWKNRYLGWDDKEKTIVIINQSHVTGQVWNIKHRKKHGFNGKWISYPRGKTFPFPFEYFRQHKYPRMIICEGEKDALNLMSIGANCLTLGGAPIRWNRNKKILKGKDIYIWFDHDQTGYDNAVKRYDELAKIAKMIKVVLFCSMDKGFDDHYDLSDYLKDYQISNVNELFDSIESFSFSNRDKILNEIDLNFNKKVQKQTLT